MNRTKMSWFGQPDSLSGVLTLVFPDGSMHSIPMGSFREAHILYCKIIKSEEIVKKNAREKIKQQFNQMMESL